ncbi:MAG: UvrD-helicase domain-containing protein [Bdellovibrionota bacterium]
MIDLSPEQREVVEAWGGGCAVIAGAGSGKTTTLVEKCIRLLSIKQDARFAAVSFTERSANDLRTKLSASMDIDKHVVTTIHGLCRMVITEFPYESGIEGDEQIIPEFDADLIWGQALGAIWLDDIPLDVSDAMDVMLKRESRSTLEELLKRTKRLAHFGALEHIGSHICDKETQALARLADFVIGRYSRLKSRSGVLDFDDLESKALVALDSAVVAATYHKRFDLLLVDEFQDTNQVQARIVSKMAKADFSNLCVVGDPKQSIYRFRDADVSVFSEFCSNLPRKFFLTRNFRSRPGIIEYVNGICSMAFLDAGMEYEPLVADRVGSGQSEVMRLDIQTEKDLAVWIKAQNKLGIPLNDMVLLTRRLRGNEQWLKALSAEGIPLAVGSGGFFWEDPRVRELVSFLKWWDCPANSLSGAVFLRAPWVGVSDEALDKWVKEDKTWIAPFFGSGCRLAVLLEPFRYLGVRPGELLLAILSDDRVEDEIGAQLLGLWHRVEELSRKGMNFHDVVRQLACLLDERRRERDVPPPHNTGQLSVLTIHSAKGLEFPHVILIDFVGKTSPQNMPLLFWDRERGVHLGERDESGARDRSAPVEAEWRELERQKNISESMRLFYVALTRAKERLLIVCPPLPKKTQEKVQDKVQSKTVFTNDNWRAWIECSSTERATCEIVDDAYINTSAPAMLNHCMREREQQKRNTIVSRIIRPRYSVTELSLLAKCQRAYEWTYIKPRRSSVVSGNAARMPQHEIGSRVHACLEKTDYNGLIELESEAGSDRFTAGPLIEWAKNTSYMRFGPASPACDDVWTELSFEVPLAGEVVVGSIDRLIADAVEGDHKKYLIVDFKVSGGKKSQAELIQHYGVQLQLYAYAVEMLEAGKAQKNNISCAIVNIFPGGVEIVDVPSSGFDLHELIHTAAALVNGATSATSYAPHCDWCAHKDCCGYMTIN